MLPLSPGYVKEVFDTPDYVQARIDDNFNFADDEFQLTEDRTGEIADEIAEWLAGKGYGAVSQSDATLLSEKVYDSERHESPLPHKTLAVLAGMGWIGKNNLLITPEYGAALCLGTVLTDAPLKTLRHEPLQPECGGCSICVDVCDKRVLRGNIWMPSLSREEMVDVYGCNTCLKCLVHCPRTQTYMKKNL